MRTFKKFDESFNFCDAFVNEVSIFLRLLRADTPLFALLRLLIQALYLLDDCEFAFSYCNVDNLKFKF